MRFKLDENLGTRALQFLRSRGHDVETVLTQDMSGAEDEVLFATCARENRVLITLDRDFGHILRFPPDSCPGIVRLEPPPSPTRESIVQRLHEFCNLLSSRPIDRELWIVEPGRVRIHERRTGEEDM